jgi:hypothetical protein
MTMDLVISNRKCHGLPDKDICRARFRQSIARKRGNKNQKKPVYKPGKCPE